MFFYLHEYQKRLKAFGGNDVQFDTLFYIQGCYVREKNRSCFDLINSASCMQN